jgi:hypothetical protein
MQPKPSARKGPTVEQADRLADILERLSAVADALSTLDAIPGSFYVDIDVRMHHHVGDGYTNRDAVRAAELLGEWLGLAHRQRNPDVFTFASAIPAALSTGHTGTTTVRAYLAVPAPAPSTPIDLDI